MDLNATTQSLETARQHNNSDQLAEALLLHANALIEALQLDQAQEMLNEAANMYCQAGKRDDEAHCHHLMANICRLQGHFEEAKSYAMRSRKIVAPNTLMALAATIELGEIALAQGKASDATDALTQAIAEGIALNQSTNTQANLLRKRAIAWVISNRPQEAVQDADTASNLLVQLGEPETALRVLIEVATALQQREETEASNHLQLKAIDVAERANDHSALADLCLLEATRSIAQRNIPRAMTAAHSARTHALKAVAPLPYINAAVAISQLAEETGDRLAAYEALAVGWVTVSDLLGREVARSMFEPKLLNLRDRWGVQSFSEIRLTYEAQRRSEREHN
jgi:tetratricopeptide (TPR) repeat protein